jgi:hypothetical protein
MILSPSLLRVALPRPMAINGTSFVPVPMFLDRPASTSLCFVCWVDGVRSTS